MCSEICEDFVWNIVADVYKTILVNFVSVDDLLSIYFVNKLSKKNLDNVDIIYQLCKKHDIKKDTSQFRDFVKFYDQKYVSHRTVKHISITKCADMAAKQDNVTLLFNLIANYPQVNFNLNRIARKLARRGNIDSLLFLLINPYHWNIAKIVKAAARYNYVNILQKLSNLYSSRNWNWLSIASKSIRYNNVEFLIGIFRLRPSGWDYRYLIQESILNGRKEILFKLADIFPSVMWDYKSLIDFSSHHYPSWVDEIKEKTAFLACNTNNKLILMEMLRSLPKSYPINYNTLASSALFYKQTKIFYDLKKIAHPEYEWNLYDIVYCGLRGGNKDIMQIISEEKIELSCFATVLVNHNNVDALSKVIQYYPNYQWNYNELAKLALLNHQNDFYKNLRVIAPKSYKWNYNDLVCTAIITKNEYSFNSFKNISILWLHVDDILECGKCCNDQLFFEKIIHWLFHLSLVANDTVLCLRIKNEFLNINWDYNNLIVAILSRPFKFDKEHMFYKYVLNMVPVGYHLEYNNFLSQMIEHDNRDITILDHLLSMSNMSAEEIIMLGDKYGNFKVVYILLERMLRLSYEPEYVENAIKFCQLKPKVKSKLQTKFQILMTQQLSRLVEESLTKATSAQEEPLIKP
jgi:hypothetical protein